MANKISEVLETAASIAKGMTEDSFVLHATHSHSGPEFVGGWGFVPDWYMAQITDTIKAVAKRLHGDTDEELPVPPRTNARR